MEDFEIHIGLLLASVLVSAICWCLKKASDLLKAKTRSVALAAFWSRADDLAERVVKETYQAAIQPLAASGKWTPEVQRAVRTAAVSKLKSYLGPDAVKMLEKLLGIPAGETLESFLETFVSAAMHDKQAAAAAGESSLAATITPIQVQATHTVLPKDSA